MKSINSTFSEDVTAFYAPSFLFLLFMLLPGVRELPIIFFFVFVILDIGHAYSTLLRSYLGDSSEKKPIMPIFLFFIGCFYFCYFGVPYFWSVILYFTFYHHLKQNYGMYCWYSQINKTHSKLDKIHIQLFAIIPFFLFHLKDINYMPLYHLSEYHPVNIGVNYRYLFLLYSAYLIIYFFHILNKWFKKKISTEVAISFLYPSFLNYICFLIFDNSYQVFIPLLVLHATTYLSVINLSLKKLRGNGYNPFKTWATIIITISVFGILEKTLSDHFNIFIDSTSMKGNIILSTIVSISVLPNLMHYYIDGFI